MCSTCSFITKSEKREDYTCIACLGADRFYDKLRNKAKGIQDRTAGVLSGSSNKIDLYTAQILFFKFGEIVDVSVRCWIRKNTTSFSKLYWHCIRFS